MVSRTPLVLSPIGGGLGMAEMVALRRDRRAIKVAEAAEGFLAATGLAASARAVPEATLLMLQLTSARAWRARGDPQRHRPR